MLGALAISRPALAAGLGVLVLLINALGYIALRTFGATRGLAIAGFFSGFVSSAATIGAMGSRARAHHVLVAAAVAGAALSSVATVVQLALVLAISNHDVLLRFAPALIGTAIVAVLYAAIFAYRAAHQTVTEQQIAGRAFQPRRAIIFALTITTTLFLSALLADRYGSTGASVGIALAGFGDAHSASASAATLALSGVLAPQAAVLAIAFAVSANTLAKAIVAVATGGWRYGRALIPGLALMLIAMWFGVWLAGFGGE